MKKQKNNILILDVEATGTPKNALIYDLGYIIFNTKTAEKTKKSFLIDEIFNCDILLASAYYKDKKASYEKGIKNGLHKLTTIKEAFNQLTRDIKDYCINDVYAYNYTYDKNAFEYTTLINNIGNIDIINNPIENLNFYDIRAYAMHGLINREYEKYCIKHNLITPRKYYNTQAQTVYGYITKNENFIAEHTGLADCITELEILRQAIKSNKRLNYGQDLKLVSMRIRE